MNLPWLTNFEAMLVRLERGVQSETSTFRDVIVATREALNSLAAVDDLLVWIVRGGQAERIDQNGSVERLTLEAANPVSSAPVTGWCDDNRCLISRTLGRNVQLVLDGRIRSFTAPQSAFLDGIGAVADLLALFTGRQLLSQYESRLSVQDVMVEIIHRLHSCRTEQEIANVVAHDVASVLELGRVSMVVRRGESWKFLAVTGTQTPDVQSAAVRAMIQAVEDIQRLEPDGQWLDAAARRRIQSSVVSAADVEPQWSRVISLTDRSVDHSRETSEPAAAVTFRDDRSPEVSSGQDSGGGDSEIQRSRAVVLLECFAGEELPDEQLLGAFMQAAGAAWKRLDATSRGTVGRLLDAIRRRWLLTAVAVIFVMCVIPVRFEVDATGQIVSSRQQRLFAPENGTIVEVSFGHEGAVRLGDVLLTIDSPDLVLQKQRLVSEIETVTTRLAAVRAGRLTGSDPRLSGDEKQLAVQMEGLQSQLDLLNQQISRLTVTAPFDGIVYHRNARQDLSGRPVQRGQLLLEIVPDDPDWRLDLMIPDSVTAYVREYAAKSGEPIRVRYQIRSAPEKHWSASIEQLDQVLQIHDGRMICRAFAGLASIPDIELRPGTTVNARISCGTRSAAFVVFREFIEVWQRVVFNWL